MMISEISYEQTSESIDTTKKWILLAYIYNSKVLDAVHSGIDIILMHFSKFSLLSSWTFSK
jgi:hypothetical protein